MTKKKDSKRSLLMSGLALVMCLVMLGGSSLAWYSDSVSAGNNKIETGVLNATMEWKDATTNGLQTTYKDATTGPIFDSDKWEPGHVEAKHVKIANGGTLDFKFRVNIIPNNPPADGELNLANFIDVYIAEEAMVVDPETFADDVAAAAAVAAVDPAATSAMRRVGTLAALMADPDGAAYGALYTKENAGSITGAVSEKIITLVLMMQKNVPNEYQGLSVGDGFTIQMVATQFTGEPDSFDNQYDNAADYPYISAPANRPASAASVEVSTPGDTGVAVSIPATTFNALPQEVTKIALAHTEAKVDVAAKTVTFDSVELVDQSGKIINLSGNTENLTITLPVSGIDNGATVDIFHDGEPMGTATVTDGKITYNVTHLCKILVAPTGSFVSSAEQLIAALTSGKSAVLLNDIAIDADTTITVKAGTTSALNLNGHTISSTNARTATHNFLIDVKGGTLSISNGTVRYQHTGANMEWNGATTVIDVTAGGVLNLNDVTVKNLGGTDMNFAVHMNNWGAVTLNADNCVFDAPYCGVRVFNSGPDMNNVKITNSKLTGATRAFWVHNYLGDLNSAQHSDEAIKARLNLDIYNNNNAFEITGEAKSPIRYGFGTTVYFNAEGSQIVDTAEGLQDAINNGSGNITLGGDIDLSDLINSGN